MAHEVRIKKRAMKSLEHVREPYYSKLKAAIYDLPMIRALADAKN